MLIERIKTGTKHPFWFTCRLLVYAAALFAVSLFFFPGLTLKPLGTFLVKNDAPVQADGIVVLLGAGLPDRVLKAHELYRDGYASKIIFSSGVTEEVTVGGSIGRVLWRPWSEPYSQMLNSLGVPPQAMVMVGGAEAYDTAQELIQIAGYARKANWQRLLLVSSAYHTRRLDFIWRRVAPDIQHATIAAQPEVMEYWWQKPVLINAVIHEWLGMVKECLTRLMHLVI